MNVRELAALHGIELPDCKGSPCVFGDAPGMRTQGGCRCERKGGPSQLHQGIHALTKLAVQMQGELRLRKEAQAKQLEVLGTQLEDLGARLASAHAVVIEAGRLRDCGYDGPFMGEAVVPLFRALAAVQK